MIHVVEITISYLHEIRSGFDSQIIFADTIPDIAAEH